MHIFKWNLIFLMLNSMQQKKKKSDKICIELDIANVEFQVELDISNIEFQSRNILLHSLKSGLFGYIIQKLRPNSHFF